MSLTIEPATLPAVLWIAGRLRAEDMRELGISTPEEAELVLYQALEVSTWARVGLIDGVPAIAYGVAPGGRLIEGTPWMLATERIHEVKKQFWGYCRAQVADMLASYPYLTNRVHVGNTVALAWLRRLGFTVDPKPRGLNGQFRKFSKVA